MEGSSSQRFKGDMRSQKSRRTWTILEEQMLVQAFKDIISQGWKAQNGFRHGFLNQLEQRLHQYIPGTDMKAEPHISSKYGSWKKTYREVYQVLSTSGFNWDTTNHTVEAPPDVWDAYVKAYPRALTLKGKPFPNYEAWVEIYGKDRATGEHAMDWRTAAEVEHIDLDEINEETEENSSSRPVELDLPDDDGTNSVVSPKKEKSKPTQSSGSRKRKAREISDDALLEVVGGFCERAATSLEKVAATLGTDMISSQRREDVYTAIGRLNMSITADDHLRASYIFTMNSKAMDMFYGLPDSAKVGMVKMALEGKLNWFPD
ncbi:hypothetical protein CDL12_17080 [Handroanthus impetiginosus]|uniref:Myb/SANT-like domain-containing protein n=1 Tax=Handroanthus impetiginosus TaxID=429701 RepID=A0A2G9GYH8_9LAMI|nr:hypothetical protein CDL12_17080 [Handroanthus impetiginosus]